jgi:hypothetical protein
MNEQKEILNILKKRRESLGLSLDDLYNKTKIRSQILKQIDDGDLNGIDQIYAISFLKSIGSVLKMSSEEIDDIIAQLGFKSQQFKKDYKANIITQKADFSKSVMGTEKTMLSSFKSFLDVKYLNYSIYFFLFILLASIIYFTFFSSGNPSGDNLPNRKIDTMVINGSSKEIENFFVPDSMVLEARGLDTAWLRIVIDGKQSEQIVMLPKMERQWIVKKFAQLSVGNGGAVEFKRNGKILEPFGSKGSVVRNVRITPTEIVVSSSPWSAPKDSTFIPKKPAVQKKKEKKKEKPQANTSKRLESSGVQETYKPFQEKKR